MREVLVRDRCRGVLLGLAAGCNPAHRTAPLAMATFLDDDVLADCALREAALTHAHPLAGDVAAAALPGPAAGHRGRRRARRGLAAVNRARGTRPRAA
jgi:ADP-ribosylglycohydrolase